MNKGSVNVQYTYPYHTCIKAAYNDKQLLPLCFLDSYLDLIIVSSTWCV